MGGRVLAGAALALLLAACDGQGAAGGGAPQSGDAAMPAPEPNLIAHVEIPVTDMDRAVAFYTTVFATDLERQTIDGYEMALFPASEGTGATAALAKGDVYRPSKAGAIVYLRVADIRATVARAEAAGGSVLYPVKDVGEFGLVGEIADSEGNRIALSQPRG
jgi:predicted enzyme related to lactoylglutathione lyase